MRTARMRRAAQRLATAIGVALALTSWPVHAQQSRSAVCTGPIRHQLAAETSDTVAARYHAPMEAWMGEQLAAGRSQFSLIPTVAGTMICAW